MSRRTFMVGDLASLAENPVPNVRRGASFEIWTCSGDGGVRRHGVAYGLTFRDACKHLSCVSVDFWTHYDRDRYRGSVLYASREEAMRGERVE